MTSEELAATWNARWPEGRGEPVTVESEAAAPDPDEALALLLGNQDRRRDGLEPFTREEFGMWDWGDLWWREPKPHEPQSPQKPTAPLAQRDRGDTMKTKTTKPTNSKAPTRRKPTAAKHPYVIVRSRDAGVHAGEYLGHRGTEVRLANSRRIWQWDGAASLSELAVYGAGTIAGCKFGVKLPAITIIGACEIIECQPSGEAMIRSCPEWRSNENQ